MKPEDMIMPFGRYRGLYLREVPGVYLRWVRDKAKAASPELKETCRQVLARSDRSSSELPQPEAP